MIKILKNYEIYNTIQNLSELMKIDDLPVKDVGWNLTKNMRKLDTSWKSFSEYEQELVKKYAIKDANSNVKYDDKGQPKFAPANEDKFKSLHTELLNCENEIEILTIKYSDIQDFKIKPILLFALDFMIEDDSK